jgi:hypothetical protein
MSLIRGEIYDVVPDPKAGQGIGIIGRRLPEVDAPPQPGGSP